MHRRILFGVAAWLLGAATATAGSLLAVSLLGQGITGGTGPLLSQVAVNRALASESAERTATPTASSGTAGTAGGIGPQDPCGRIRLRLAVVRRVAVGHAAVCTAPSSDRAGHARPPRRPGRRAGGRHGAHVAWRRRGGQLPGGRRLPGLLVTRAGLRRRRRPPRAGADREGDLRSGRRVRRFRGDHAGVVLSRDSVGHHAQPGAGTSEAPAFLPPSAALDARPAVALAAPVSSASVGHAPTARRACAASLRGTCPSSRRQDRVAPWVEADHLGQQLGAHAVADAGDRVDVQPHASSCGTSSSGTGSSGARRTPWHAPAASCRRASAAPVRSALRISWVTPSG